MAIDLTTGVPGAGKTLFTVSEVLRPLVGAKLEHEGRQIERRLMIGGIRDLLLDHQMIDVPVFDPERQLDEFGAIERLPGDAPVAFVTRDGDRWRAAGLVDGEPPAGAVPLPVRADNWWLWCQPGDVIVVDECQRLFRPMASGRKIPQCIAKLETHRHYGVDFVIVTQHPQLLHTNVRNLVGRHRHVRRLFGRGQTFVYEWDHCSNPDRIKAATARFWRHKKAAFGLYKSAEIHTKHKHAIGLPFVMGAVALLLLPWLFWRAYGVMTHKDKLQAQAAPSPAASTAMGTVAQAGGGVVQAPPAWPVLNVSARPQMREPYADRGLHIEGSYSVGQAVRYMFSISVNGKRMTTVTDVQLSSIGYAWQPLGPCSGVLMYGGKERAVTCDAPVQAPAPQTQGQDKAPSETAAAPGATAQSVRNG